MSHSYLLPEIWDDDLPEQNISLPPKKEEPIIQQNDNVINVQNNNAIEMKENLVSVSLETDYEHYDEECSHTFKASITIQPNSKLIHRTLGLNPLDLVIIFDSSSSMKFNDKIEGVLASINYIIDILTEKDRFALVMFSKRASVLHRLTIMTEANKLKIRSTLKTIKSKLNQGTNIGEGLEKGIEILESRGASESAPFPVSLIMLLTDGEITVGKDETDVVTFLQEKKFLKSKTLESLTINCFGYGLPHPASFLQDIAFTTPNGMYYYVRDACEVGRVFGESLYYFFNIIAQDISLSIKSFAGIRIFQVKTIYPSYSVVEGKEIRINTGFISKGDKRTFILVCSCKSVEKVHTQEAFLVSLNYYSPHFEKTSDEILFYLSRKKVEENLPNLSVDIHSNRYLAAKAISEALQFSEKQLWEDALDVMTKAVTTIGKSKSVSQVFCVDLLHDLNDCVVNMNKEVFNEKRYEMYALANMYYKERATGVTVKPNSPRVNESYAYRTIEIEDVGKKASIISAGYRILE